MDEILSIRSGIAFDESIAHYEQDLCFLPSRSSIHICGKLQVKGGSAALAKTKFVNNAICHPFDKIRYEINAVEIDKSKNVGLSSIMKGLISFNLNQNDMLENAGWLGIQDNIKSVVDDKGNFDVVIPLSMILGTIASGVTTYEDYEVKVSKIEWLMPYVVASDKQQIQLLNFIGKDNPISMCFRSWELFEYPLLPSTTKHVWTVKTSNQLEKPRFVILGLHTKRISLRTANASRFDHSLVVIDCSRQNESPKSAPVDVCLEFEAKKDFPANTSAYCLILHDRIVQYNPISGDVKKLV
ncbi:uncharacterized protein LOC116417886 [Nasonia vitripennis]|uniref:Double jelly roll-like domain-containing protein n=1 Tax=Nasonia vitripennis TaxID=7425 RepID=A0A7M7QME5_NASVI|nr:uncharacterized protein LOC116417886 [Nasonia vitripennis]